MHGLSPKFHIHVSVSDLYIPRIGHSAAEQADRSWKYINRSQTHECRNWDCGRSIPFMGIQYLFRIFCIGSLQCTIYDKEFIYFSLLKGCELEPLFGECGLGGGPTGPFKYFQHDFPQPPTCGQHRRQRAHHRLLRPGFPARPGL